MCLRGWVSLSKCPQGPWWSLSAFPTPTHPSQWPADADVCMTYSPQMGIRYFHFEKEEIELPAPLAQVHSQEVPGMDVRWATQHTRHISLRVSSAALFPSLLPSLPSTQRISTFQDPFSQNGSPPRSTASARIDVGGWVEQGCLPLWDGVSVRTSERDILVLTLQVPSVCLPRGWFHLPCGYHVSIYRGGKDPLSFARVSDTHSQHRLKSGCKITSRNKTNHLITQAKD